MFNELRWHGVANIWRWPVPMVTTTAVVHCDCGRSVKGTAAAYSARTGCDFFGYTRSGRAVTIEAKSIDRASISLGGEGSGVKAHQLAALLEAHRCGAISLLLWRRGGFIRAIPAVGLIGKEREAWGDGSSLLGEDALAKELRRIFSEGAG